ncbi:ribonuclease P [Candidatus Woesearchaeota archaeon]|nr:ribonuclease P [Candidatus Woesearchaeota archaeon]
MAKKYGKKKNDIVKEAKNHIASLFEKAKFEAGTRHWLANRYVTLARKVAMKFKIHMTREQKRLFCPHCYRFLLPGKNLRVRVHEHRLIYYCLDCKKFWRKPLDKKKKKIN